jgi:cellulose synthase/poly-beta-1,6-N-acetylglucosamine synthase-like glycosyltransferase
VAEVFAIAMLALLGLAAALAVPLYVLLAAFLLRRREALAAESALLARADIADELPRVLIQIPTHNEPRVIARALGAAAAMTWPRDKLEIQVLDDSTDETGVVAEAAAAELRRAGARIEIIKRANRAGFKAGALQAGLARSDAPYVAMFDADYVPPADWLRSAYAPMRADERIAFVQTRIAHLNRDANALTRAQALMLDLHYAFEQPARAWCGLPNRFNGTCGLWRRRAIDDAGGWSATTLAEDLDIAYRAQSLGWRAAYLVTVSAPGELPASWRDWKSQQYRWTKGTAEATLKTLGGILPRLSWWRRCVLIANAAAETLLPIIVVLAVAAGVAHIAASGRFYDPLLTAAIWATIAIHGVPRIAAVMLSQRLVAGGPRGGLLGDLAVALAFEISLIAERIRAAGSALAGRKSGFARTEKRGA